MRREVTVETDVRAIQAEINAAGYTPQLVLDNKRGPKTRAGERWLAAQRAAAPWADAVPGIDVSDHQRDIDGRRIREAGYRWGIVKATEGTGYRSGAHAPQQIREIRQHDMVLAGFYHFPGRRVRLRDARRVRVTGTPTEEAEHYLRTVDAWGGLPPGAYPILDIEGCDYRHDDERAVLWWVEWIETVEQRTCRPVLRYTLAAYLWAHARQASAELRARLADGPLWWAEYGTRRDVRAAPGKDPSPWTPDQILVHQYEGRKGYLAARVPGVVVACDVNRMRRGTWMALAEAQGVSL